MSVINIYESTKSCANQEVGTRRQKLFLNLNEHLQIFFELNQNKQTNKIFHLLARSENATP